MTVKTSTGTLLSVVQGVPATFDKAGYEALDYVDVGEVTDIPEYGPVFQVVTHEPLATGITQKHKGFVDYGSITYGLGQDTEDAGQKILLDSALIKNINESYSVCITISDGTKDYFTGKIFSYTTNPGSANSIIGSSAQFEINTAIVRVLPTP